MSNLTTPKEPQNMSCKHMELSTTKWTGKTSLLGNVKDSPLCVYKYSIGSFKTHSKDEIYHMLGKAPKFSTTEM